MARSFLLALAEEERLKMNVILHRRHLRDMSDPMQLPEHDFVAKFRLTKPQYIRLCDDVLPILPIRKSSAIHPQFKIFAALALFGSGVYQRVVGDMEVLAMSQSAVHDCLWEVTHALNDPKVLEKYIQFPMTPEARNSVARRFMEKYKIPGILGCIDGTHVRIFCPIVHEEGYFNRKMYHSLNVLIICDADLRILHIDASFGGASHDSHVWNLCPVQTYMQQLNNQGDYCYLLGDSGYAQKDYLMTPILHAEAGSPEEHYTRCHVRTRNVVERCIGVLKSRWRCLFAKKGLQYSPIRSGKIVNACAVLHNLAIDTGFPVDQDFQRDLQWQINIPFEGPQSGPDDRRRALVARLWNSRRV